MTPEMTQHLKWAPEIFLAEGGKKRKADLAEIGELKMWNPYLKTL
jgi:hypothetical protein